MPRFTLNRYSTRKFANVLQAGSDCDRLADSQWLAPTGRLAESQRLAL